MTDEIKNTDTGNATADEASVDAPDTTDAAADEVVSERDGAEEALRSVIDPEIGMNVIELGLVRQIDVEADSAHITMIMTTPFCPYAPQLLEQTRRTAQDYLGKPTTIEMGMEMWDPSMMEDGAAGDWGLF